MLQKDSTKIYCCVHVDIEKDP